MYSTILCYFSSIFSFFYLKKLPNYHIPTLNTCRIPPELIILKPPKIIIYYYEMFTFPTSKMRDSLRHIFTPVWSQVLKDNRKYYYTYI